jgi:hypothetical protein
MGAYKTSTAGNQITQMSPVRSKARPILRSLMEI